MSRYTSLTTSTPAPGTRWAAAVVLAALLALFGATPPAAVADTTGQTATGQPATARAADLLETLRG